MVETFDNDTCQPAEFDKDTFLEAVRKLPSLWDVNHIIYKAVKTKAWKKLALYFNKEEDFLHNS